MNNNKRALKSGVWYTASNFLVRSIGFITTPIFTRILTHSDFGIYNNYTSWLSIITIFITLNLESTLISARYNYKDKFDTYILSMLSLSALNAFIWFVCINLFKNKFEIFFDLDIKYLNVMLVYLLFLPAVNMFQARERYYFEYKRTVVASLILSIGTALLSVVLVINLSNKLTGRILGGVIPTVLLGIVFCLYFIKKGKQVKISYWKYAIPICLPYIPHLLSMTVLNSTDRVMIMKMCGSEQNALYSLAYTCGTMVTLLMTSLNGAYAPWLGEKLNEGKEEEIHKFSYIYIMAFSFLTIGIMLVSPEVLYILGGKSYMEAVYILTPISMGCECQFLYTMFVNVEQFKKKTIGMAIGSVLAAFTNFILNLFLIPKAGYLAAAYTTLAGYLLLLVLHMYLVKKLGLSSMYDYKFIWIIIGLGMLLMLIITVLYSYIIIRYMTICIYIIIMFIIIFKYKNKLYDFLNRKGV